MIPHLCPVCLGTGNVCGGFYNCCPGGTPVSANTMEKCRSCINGIIYGTEGMSEMPYSQVPLVPIDEKTANFGQFSIFEKGDTEDKISVLKDIRGHLLTIIEELQKIGRNV